ncbi:MAG: amino acid permease, partial [Bacteroidota bacterium]
LGAVFPRSGGEYNLLGRVYHPALGFVAGWVSVTVGFAAPASLAAMAFASYIATIFPSISLDHTAAACVLVLSVLHGASVSVGSRFQNIMTLLKVGLILLFVVLGLTSAGTGISWTPSTSSWSEITSGSFAVSLVYVAYAYTGWNSSIYIIDEMKAPRRDLPRSLFIGTLIVTLLYVALNMIFLHTVPIADLAGKIEVGVLSAESIFGAGGTHWVVLAIAVLLISTVSSYVFLGPRVSKVMGEDLVGLSWLSKTNHRGIPLNAFIFSTILSLIFIYTGTFEQVLVYTSFLLILITTLTVGGVFIVRWKRLHLSASYKTWGYPLTPAIFVLVSLWMLVFVVMDKPGESMVGVVILIVGLILYYRLERRGKKGH